jgi:hypothetical protein
MKWVLPCLVPMRPKARGLFQHGRTPGWVEESNPAECDFVCDGRSSRPQIVAADDCGNIWLLTASSYPQYSNLSSFSCNHSAEVQPVQ